MKPSEKGLPGTDYAWAVDPGTGEYFKLNGYWWGNNLTDWENMFYTGYDKAKLAGICEKTLKKLGKGPLVQMNAADTDESFNYDIWFNDKPGSHPARLVTFGDSLSDTGNLFNSSSWKIPSQESWYLGRLSNGPVWSEYIANKYHLSLYNWAVAMAGTEQQYEVLPGINSQIESFREYVGKADNFDPSSCLAAIMIGGNDFMSYNTDVKTMSDIVGEAVEKIVATGVTNILVMNMMDITIAPKFRMDHSLDKVKISGNIDKYNSLLSQKITEAQNKHQDAKIKLISMNEIVKKILSDNKYGITNTVDSCLDTNDNLDYANKVSLRSICRDPNVFAFWDMLHPTTRVHSILADEIVNYINKQYPDISSRFLKNPR